MDSIYVDKIQGASKLYPNCPLVVRVRNGSQVANLLAYYRSVDFKIISFSQLQEKNAPFITFDRGDLENKFGLVMDENYYEKGQIRVIMVDQVKHLLFSEKNEGKFLLRDKMVRLNLAEKKGDVKRVIKPVGYFQGLEEPEQAIYGRQIYTAYLGLVPENEISLPRKTPGIRSRRKFKKKMTLDTMLAYQLELPFVIEVITGSKDIREINV